MKYDIHSCLKRVLFPAMIAFSPATAAANHFQEPAGLIPETGKSVVKIHTTRRLPNFIQPWTKKAPEELSGSGVILAGRRILTNAHVVMHARQVYVQPYHSSDKISAEVVAIAPGIDLALLQLDDESFFDDRPAPLLEPKLPKVKDKVTVFGFPMGGSDLSITEGIVSRIEYEEYYFDAAGVRIQVDAALNPGNSGGPAFSGDKVIGLVFSGIRVADGIGYLIPTEEIERFLADVEDGEYEGIPRLRDELTTLENDALRSRLGAAREVTGLVVRRPADESDHYPLKRWDVLTHIGEHKISNDGRVDIDDSLRLRYAYFVPQLAKNGRVPMTVFRAGQSLDVEVPVESQTPLVAPTLGNRYPRYFIYGPLVFSSATQEFISGAFGAVGPGLVARGSRLAARWTDEPAFPGEELVFVTSPMFPHKLTKGYGDPIFNVLSDVNGVSIENLAHLVKVLHSMEAPFVEFSFFDRGRETLIFERRAIEEATEEILNDNGIRNECSPDLRDL